MASGRDVISGGAGNDTIRLGNDGERDVVSCGAGNRDVVWGADSKDVMTRAARRSAGDSALSTPG
ncbi:MAG: hypothetical protein ACRDRK_26330 [Pseudonocardia sp.]